MRAKTFLFLCVILIGLVIYLKPDILEMLKPPSGGGGGDTNVTENITIVKGNSSSLSIANWNLRIFGADRVSDNSILESYAQIIDDFDIVILQEIMDETQTAIPKLCDKLIGYTCVSSERKSRTSARKEQYVMAYKSALVTTVTIIESQDYAHFERPPTAFKIDNLTILTLHSKPNETKQELDYLDDYADTFSGRVVVLGDMNLDGAYYSGEPPVFTNWTWVIPDGCDSTVAASQNCYDRIWINFDEPYTYGIYDNITSAMSDHKLVWVSF